jgi:hypothetical protein
VVSRRQSNSFLLEASPAVEPASLRLLLDRLAHTNWSGVGSRAKRLKDGRLASSQTKPYPAKGFKTIIYLELIDPHKEVVNPDETGAGTFRVQ